MSSDIQFDNVNYCLHISGGGGVGLVKLKVQPINTRLRETTITKDTTKPLVKAIRIDESEIRGCLNELVRGTVEETLNELLDAEADAMCGAQRYGRSADRVDTRDGHYTAESGRSEQC